MSREDNTASTEPGPARYLLTVPDVLAMHAAMTMRYGWLNGPRDISALETTLDAVATATQTDLPGQAALLFEGLFNRRPFRQGNAALAFAATDSFLRINDWRIASPAWTLKAQIGQLGAPGSADGRRIEDWIRGIAQPIA